MTQVNEYKFNGSIYYNNEYLNRMVYLIDKMNKEQRNPVPMLQQRWMMYFDKDEKKWTSEYFEAGALPV